MTITEFLEARIAEDEADARDRPNSAQIHYSGCYYYNYSLDAGWECDCDEDGAGTRRLLAECAAKRAIIQYVTGLRLDRGRDAEIDAQYRATWWIATQLAKAYKDHADYEPEWAL